MYRDTKLHVKTCGITEDFPIAIRLHQGSPLSHFLFAEVIDEVTWSIKDMLGVCCFVHQ